MTGETGNPSSETIPTVPELPPHDPVAWQPFTPGGVAAFASSSWGHLWVVQGIFALLAALAITWSIQHTWLDAVGEAITRLPDQGQISQGVLEWDTDAQNLAYRKFLSIGVNPGTVDSADAADVQVIFGKREARVRSLLGWISIPYPADMNQAFNHKFLWPWWGAWRLPIIVTCFGCCWVTLFLLWNMIGLLYMPAAWMIAHFADRKATLMGSWRLASAAMLPGGGFAACGFVFYGLGTLDLVRLAFVMVFHIIIGWVYLGVSPHFLPRIAHPNALGTNPFTVSATPAAPDKNSNPFANAP